jgi:hypothetical protein
LFFIKSLGPAVGAFIWQRFLFCVMNFDTFRVLSPLVQLFSVWKVGTFLTQRWDEDGNIKLYHVADEGRGFFVEVGLNEEHNRPVVLRSYVSSVPLEDYSHNVRLPEGWD